ncbi:response regulator [Bordetella petrii]|nr:response regulator [Bordetella petrii]
MAAELLAEFLALSDIEVQIAGTGADALERSAAFEPDAIILDILLPDTNGYDLAARLRAQHPRAPRLIALSGLPRGQHGGDASVFDGWVEKPADPDALTALLLND